MFNTDLRWGKRKKINKEEEILLGLTTTLYHPQPYYSLNLYWGNGNHD